MEIKELRLEFSKAFQEFQNAVRRMGAHAYNLLHNPKRDEYIKQVEDALTKMKDTAKKFQEESEKFMKKLKKNPDETSEKETSKKVGKEG